MCEFRGLKLMSDVSLSLYYIWGDVCMYVYIPNLDFLIPASLASQLAVGIPWLSLLSDRITVAATPPDFFMGYKDPGFSPHIFMANFYPRSNLLSPFHGQLFDELPNCCPQSNCTNLRSHQLQCRESSSTPSLPTPSLFCLTERPLMIDKSCEPGPTVTTFVFISDGECCL